MGYPLQRIARVGTKWVYPHPKITHKPGSNNAQNYYVKHLKFYLWNHHLKKNLLPIISKRWPKTVSKWKPDALAKSGKHHCIIVNPMCVYSKNWPPAMQKHWAKIRNGNIPDCSVHTLCCHPLHLVTCSWVIALVVIFWDKSTMQFLLNSTSNWALKSNFALPFGTFFELTKTSVFAPYDTSEFKKDF